MCIYMYIYIQLRIYIYIYIIFKISRTEFSNELIASDLLMLFANNATTINIFNSDNSNIAYIIF